MTAIDNFGQFRPFTVGFDKLFSDMERISNINDNFPPYNVIKSDEDSYIIELAVAGFSKDELFIEFKDSILKVEGKKETREIDFTHKGISERNFVRSWTLGEYVKVKGAEVKDGLLVISLEREIPEEEKPQVIKIK
jgi:molecular chaperone IbpA